jgi:hypothetical protein
VQGRLGVDDGLVAVPADVVIADVEDEAPGDLVTVDDLPRADASCPPRGCARRSPDPGPWPGAPLWRRGGRRTWRPAAGCDRRLPLAGVVRAGDLGQVPLIEEAELERAAV